MSEFFTALVGFFKFFDTVKEFIKLLEKTPEEKHIEVIQSVQKQFDGYAKTNRPPWG